MSGVMACYTRTLRQKLTVDVTVSSRISKSNLFDHNLKIIETFSHV